MYKEIFKGEFRVEDGKKILQCHSKGNKEFSPFFCYVTAFGKRDSIENHYQCAKRFENCPTPSSWRDVKVWEKQKILQINWQIGHLLLPVKSNEQGNSFVLEDYGIQYYIKLWHKHLKENPEKLVYAKQFDDFEDPFAGYFPFCQAEVIKVATREGVDALVPYFAELRELFLKKD
jgi:hypothetical protein